MSRKLKINYNIPINPKTIRARYRFEGRLNDLYVIESNYGIREEVMIDALRRGSVLTEEQIRGFKILVRLLNNRLKKQQHGT